jgi:putative sterol carrier protein
LISPGDYFMEFLAGRMHRPLLAGYDGLSAAFTIRFRDGADCWLIRVNQGCIVEIRPAATPDEAPIQYDVDRPVFEEMVSGSLSPQKAFFLRRTDIHGDLFKGMKMARVLGLFFAANPYRNDRVKTDAPAPAGMGEH